MKIATVSLLMALACSCHKTAENPTVGRSGDTMERREEVRAIISSYFHAGIDFVRGPLTVREVQKELIQDAERASSPGRRIIPGGPEWEELKAKLKRGDELYFYKTDPQSWQHLRGREGYVAIREKEVIDDFLTLMN
jgi:hypothetical protein